MKMTPPPLWKFSGNLSVLVPRPTPFFFGEEKREEACLRPDMEFVQNFTPPDFQAKNFTPSISPNFNSFSKKKHKKLSENGEIYTAGNKFYTPAGTDGMDKFHL